MLTKHAVRKVVLKDQGVSTLGALDIWFDDTVLRLNAEKRGQYLGAFKGDDKILAVFSNGQYRLMNFDLSNHFEVKPVLLEKSRQDTVIAAVYVDGETGFYYMKRFKPDANGKPVLFIGEHKESRLILVSTAPEPGLWMRLAATTRKPESEEFLDAASFIAVKSHKARSEEAHV